MSDPAYFLLCIMLITSVEVANGFSIKSKFLHTFISKNHSLKLILHIFLVRSFIFPGASYSHARHVEEGAPYISLETNNYKPKLGNQVTLVSQIENLGKS